MAVGLQWLSTLSTLNTLNTLNIFSLSPALLFDCLMFEREVESCWMAFKAALAHGCLPKPLTKLRCANYAYAKPYAALTLPYAKCENPSNMPRESHDNAFLSLTRLLSRCQPLHRTNKRPRLLSHRSPLTPKARPVDRGGALMSHCLPSLYEGERP